MQQYIDAYRSDPEFARKSDETMQRLLVRSATDDVFRRKLVDDPASAFAEFTGRDASEFRHINVRFIENKADATFVLPAPIDPSGELSASDLETVAGGDFGITLGIALVVGAVLFCVSEGMSMH
jgi:hypothetical protein